MIKHLPRLALRLLGVAGWACGALLASAAQAAGPVMVLEVRARSDAPPVSCARRPPPASSRPTEPAMGMPADEDMDAIPADETALPQGQPRPSTDARLTRPARLGIWGDSHLAAGFFTEELLRQLGMAGPGGASPRFIPATVGRAGVRLPVRTACASPEWKYEAAYRGAEGARRPGPGLVNMVSSTAGAELKLDLRGTVHGTNLRLLFDGTEPAKLGLTVDGGEATELDLGGDGPALLELRSDEPLSTVQLQLRSGHLRFHGLDLGPVRGHQVDSFGYPGATVAGWSLAQADYLRPWFGDSDYDLVVLEFGTNEGARVPFDEGGYRDQLVAALGQLRANFPAAACLLIGPGDRGVLLPRARSPRRKAPTGASAHGARVPRPGVAPQVARLLKFSRVHDRIDRVQMEVSRSAGCGFWSAFRAMGGAGSAYRWARAQPALMAGDLTHFTVAGYHRLAQKMAMDLGWVAAPAQSADPRR